MIFKQENIQIKYNFSNFLSIELKIKNKWIFISPQNLWFRVNFYPLIPLNYATDVEFKGKILRRII